MTLKQSILTVVLSFLGVCLAIPIFSTMITNAITERMPEAYEKRIGGEIYTLFLNNCTTTLTIFTEHGKPLLMDIERVRSETTSVAFQEMELRK